MTHQVLSRKYRPQRFDACVGQEHVARIFQNALASGRAGHAYLLVGPRGVGKTTTARIVARALNCETLADPTGMDPAAIEPCGTCASCVDIAAGSDLDVVEMDAASNNAVDDVRALREQVGYATVRSRYRIWIVDEVHMLSLPAFNAFLKTLEEPPAQVKFLFCTTEEHKLPDTFRSRCQRVEFRPIDAATMAARLESLAEGEGVALEDGVALAIARGALGGLRDAESQLEQLIAARVGDDPIRQADLDALSGRASGEHLATLLEAVGSRDAARALDAVDACLASGCKPGVLIDQWLEALRAGMVAAVREGDGYAKSARGIEILLGKRAHVRAGADGALVCQVAAVELARLPDARDLDRLVEALRGSGDAGARTPAPTSTPGRASAGGAAPPDPARGPHAASPRTAPAAAPAPRPTPPPVSQAPKPKAAPRRASAPAVPRPVAPDPTGLDLARVTEAWGELVQRAAVRSAVLGRALGAVRPMRLEGDTVLVEAPPRGTGGEAAAEARGTLKRREVLLAFGQITRELFGTVLRARVFDPAAAPRVVRAEEHAMRDHPAVQMVTEATGGRLLDVEKRGDAGEDDGGA